MLGLVNSDVSDNHFAHRQRNLDSQRYTDIRQVVVAFFLYRYAADDSFVDEKCRIFAISFRYPQG